MDREYFASLMSPELRKEWAQGLSEGDVVLSICFDGPLEVEEELCEKTSGIQIVTCSDKYLLSTGISTATGRWAVFPEDYEPILQVRKKAEMREALNDLVWSEIPLDAAQSVFRILALAGVIQEQLHD